MKCVIIRDDDTNATTPVACLEQLYRPFLDRRLPVCLATIPEVCTDIYMPDGELEGFLRGPHAGKSGRMAFATNPELVDYLRANRFEIVQHGLSHAFKDGRPEFDSVDAAGIARKLERGAELLCACGFEKPVTFVAPQDRMTAVSLREVAKRFRIVSTGWYEWRRLPRTWLPAYALKKAMKRPHWRVGNTLLLTHPGCILSKFRDRSQMLDRIRRQVLGNDLTVIVTHWWEYFPHGEPDQPFIDILHQTAHWLASTEDVRVLRFSEIQHEDTKNTKVNTSAVQSSCAP